MTDTTDKSSDNGSKKTNGPPIATDENNGNFKNIINHSLKSEMETSYLSYAMSVIVCRAFPDARDGLKPVHRRILYSMDQIHRI